jgi:hypothetical protein
MGRRQRSRSEPKFDLAQIKREVKADLAAAGSPSARIHLAMGRIRELSSEPAPDSRPRCVVYCISAFVQHSQKKCLEPSDINRILSLAQGLLKVMESEEQLLCENLSWELYLALSRIQIKAGMHLEAAWAQQTAELFVSDVSPEHESLAALAAAIRLLRLGHATHAAEKFARALTLKLNKVNMVRAVIGYIQALRLAGRNDTAAEFLQEQMQLPGWSEDDLRDLQWENEILAAVREGSPLRLQNLTRSGGTHFSGTYFLEARLWTYACHDEVIRNRAPKITSLVRNDKLKLPAKGALYDLASAIEFCYDATSPLPVRVAALGTAFASRHEAVTVEVELLFLAAAARWLVSTRLHSFAKLALLEYQALCQKLSHGKVFDLFNVVGDLMERKWFQLGAA